MRSLTRILTIAGLSLLTTSGAQAHHAEPLYDMKHPATVTGVVSRVDWSNPHVYLYLNVKSENGGTEEWPIELPAPHSLLRAGWTSTSVKAGDQIACTGGRAKSGARALRAVTVQFPDGKTLRTEK